MSAVALVAAALAGTAGRAEEEEVGITPVAVGSGPYYLDTAEQHDIRVDILTRGLAHAYRIAFLPGDDALIVERGVRLRLLRNVTGIAPVLVGTPVAGAPNFSHVEHVNPDDVLGIQDVAVDPDFAKTHFVYYTYNRPVGYDSKVKRLLCATVLAKARLQGLRLVDARDLIVGEAAHGVGGSRILLGKNNMVYLTVGALDTDIGSPQRLDNIYGKMLRIKADGGIPDDNPYVKKKGARAEIYALGLRDALGLAFERRTGSIIASEEGPQGGDKIDRMLPGRNYGWPKYTWGTEYGGSPVPTMPVGPGTEPPLMVWLPDIAPSGIVFYDGDRIPAWKNNLFVASARRGEIDGTGALIRVVFNDKLQETREESMLDGLHQRFRDITEGPDGLLYALTDEDDSVLVRISPVRHQPR
jgi:glucose/arabinose dehydrogenase